MKGASRKKLRKLPDQEISGLRSSPNQRDHGELNSNSFGSPSPPTLRVVVGIEGEEGEEKNTAGEERRRPSYNKNRERGDKGKSRGNVSHKKSVP